MERIRFVKELYAKPVLIKAAYNFTDRAYIHLDADDQYYYVEIRPKSHEQELYEDDFVNEMLAQSVRHEVYLQTHQIRELLYARSLASSLVVNESYMEDEFDIKEFSENEILKDWFE